MRFCNGHIYIYARHFYTTTALFLRFLFWNIQKQPYTREHTYVSLFYMVVFGSSKLVEMICAQTSTTCTHIYSCLCKTHGATHCNTLQHTATHCNTLQHINHMYTGAQTSTIHTCIVDVCELQKRPTYLQKRPTKETHICEREEHKRPQYRSTLCTRQQSVSTIWTSTIHIQIVDVYIVCAQTVDTSCQPCVHRRKMHRLWIVVNPQSVQKRHV